MKKLSLAILLLTSPLTALADSATLGNGPARVANAYPLAVSQLTVLPDTAEVIGQPGQVETISSINWSNTYNDDRKLTADGESVTFEQAATVSLSERTDLSASLAIHQRSGGTLDSATDRWHQSFGLPRGGRDDVANDRFRIRGINEDGSNFLLEDGSVGIGDLQLRTKSVWFENITSSTQISTAFSLQLPTGSKRYSNGGVELMAEVLLAHKIDSFVLHTGAGFAHSTEDDYQGAKLEQNRPGGFLSAEYLWSENSSVGTSYIISAHPNAPISIIPEIEQYWDFFATHNLDSFGKIEAVIRENPCSGNTTTDITFFLSLTHNWGDAL